MTESPVTTIYLGSNNSSSNASFDTDSDSKNDTEFVAYHAYHSLWSFGSYLDEDGIIKLELVTMGIVIPIIAVVGVVTNALNIAVLACLTKRKASPIYRILLAMAAADILVPMCFLCIGFRFYARPDPVLLFNYDEAGLSDAESVFYERLNNAVNVFGFTSNWCTVAMTTFRFVAVFFPMKASIWCTRRRATVTVAAIVTVAVLLTAPAEALIVHLFPSNASSTYLLLKYHVAYKIASNVLPWILCVILVALLLITLRKRWSDTAITARHHVQNSGRRRQLTITLVSTAAWFVVTTAPNTFCAAVTGYWDSDSRYSLTPVYRLFFTGQILALMNYNGNFFFYSFMNSSHRQQLKVLLHITSPCKLHKSNKTLTSSKQTIVAEVATVP